MNIESLESDIVNRLAPLSGGGVEIITMPENTSTFNKAIDEARITVAFNGAEYEETTSTEQVTQYAVLTTGVVIQARKLRGARGIYQLFNSIRKLLIGFEPTDCERMTMKSFELYSDEEDLFTFIAMFKCKCMNVENFTEDLPITVTQIQVDNDTFYDPSIVIDSNTTL